MVYSRIWRSGMAYRILEPDWSFGLYGWFILLDIDLKQNTDRLGSCVELLVLRTVTAALNTNHPWPHFGEAGRS